LKRIALGAASAAIIGLAACSHAAAPAAHASHRTVTVPVSCKKQYGAWEHGQGKGLTAVLHAVSVAGTAGDPQMLSVALKKAKPAVAEAARHPIPACADPRGYWSVLLMHVDAAVASRHSPSSLHAAMKDVPRIERNLTVEVKRATL
jgi:hypothetical protein